MTFITAKVKNPIFWRILFGNGLKKLEKMKILPKTAKALTILFMQRPPLSDLKENILLLKYLVSIQILIYRAAMAAQIRIELYFSSAVAPLELMVIGTVAPRTTPAI